MKEAAKRAKTTAMKAARRPRSAARAMAVAATMGGEGAAGVRGGVRERAGAKGRGRGGEDRGDAGGELVHDADGFGEIERGGGASDGGADETGG